MRCLNVDRREPVGKERVEKPKGNNGVRLEKGTKGTYSIQNIGERVLKN